MGYGVYKGNQAAKFDEGLRVKVEQIADTNRDGKLNIEEMLDVYKAVNADSSRLYNGFYLSTDERQNYLKTKGQFNPETDTSPDFGNPSANYEKAVKDGKARKIGGTM